MVSDMILVQKSEANISSMVKKIKHLEITDFHRQHNMMPWKGQTVKSEALQFHTS